MDLEVLQMNLELLEQNYKNLVEVTNDRNKKFDNDFKKMMSVNRELEIKVEKLNYNLKEKHEKIDEISNELEEQKNSYQVFKDQTELKIKEKNENIDEISNELEEQKNSYQVYKDKADLKIKEKNKKIDEISNQNVEKQKRIKNKNLSIQRLKDDLKKSKSNFLKKEKNYSELVSKQKIENDRARNIITKVLSTDSDLKKNIVSEVEVIPNSQLNTVQSNALIDSYNQMLKRAYLLLERSRNI